MIVAGDAMCTSTSEGSDDTRGVNLSREVKKALVAAVMMTTIKTSEASPRARGGRNRRAADTFVGDPSEQAR